MTAVTEPFRAWRCHAFGDYHDLKLETVAPPPAVDELEPDQCLLETRAFAAGFPDMLMVQGGYQLRPPLPFTPCAEFSADVLAVGAAVNGLHPGDRVMGSVRAGAAAERVVASAADCVAAPPVFDDATAAAFLVAYKTAYVGLVTRGRLQAGETVLVHGAGGGVGLAAVEVARLQGARVIAMASGAEKLAAASARGAEHVIDYAEGDFRTAVKALTAGRGADVIYDPVGGDVFDRSMRCIAPFGRLLVIGFASGRIPTVAVNYALIKQIEIIGVRAGEYGRLNPAGGQAVNKALAALAASGDVAPQVYARLPFTGLIEAFDMIAGRKVIGRVVIECRR